MRLRRLVSRAGRGATEVLADARYTLAAAGFAPNTDSFRRLVLLSTIRTGSTMLGYRLAEHPAIVMFQEIYHVFPRSVSFQRRGFRRRSRSSHVIGLRNDAPSRFLEEVVFAPKPKGTRWVGFRLMYGQARVDDPFWFERNFDHWYPEGRPPSYGTPQDNVRRWLEERADEVSVIHLLRENLFDQYFSGEIAKATGAWGEGATGGYRTDSDFRITLDPTHTIQHIEATARMMEEGRAWCANFHSLETTYDAVTNGDGMDQIFDFLGLVEDREVPTRSRKQSVSCWRLKVTNADEVCTALDRAGYGHFLT